MGGCQSCLGQRERQHDDENEENRLLYDETSGMQYGSFGDQALNGEHDTVETQRENEALQRVVAKTSSNMVDIFDIAPQDVASGGTSTPFAYTGQGARVARYQHLVSKLSTEDGGEPPGVKIDWLEDQDNLELQSNKADSIKTLEEEGGGPLVGTFADAAAAMQ